MEKRGPQALLSLSSRLHRTIIYHRRRRRRHRHHHYHHMNKCRSLERTHAAR